ncbi:MAG: 7-cyano-7-deazaguanine synthase QueC [Campylobacteraceae bacterium]|nr:7-cyano-7-deazaguanine synthase QueC [Campylobacteraceae bacterium]
MKKALCIISGGMDSTLCAYMAKNNGYEIVALHFDYNQRTMEKERECFNEICDDLGVLEREIIDVSFISQIGANALTDMSLEVPKSGVGDTGMKKEVPITYVPFRNGIFLSIAAALAEKESCEAIYIGVESSSGYPDCTNEFINSMENSINLGRVKKSKIVTPLVDLSKAEIVKKAVELNVPLHKTWSCYERSDKACGLCDSCRLRLEGFKEAGVEDKIPYV